MTNVKDLIGIEFKPYSYEIEKGKIKELVTAIGDDNPIYTSIEAAKAAGYERIPVPLTFRMLLIYGVAMGLRKK